MAFNAAFENGAAARSFAADAYDCIMVRIRKDLPNTRLRRVEVRMASSPWIIRRAVARCRQRAAVLASVKDKAFGAEAPSLTATARDGKAHDGRVEECSRRGSNQRVSLKER